VQCHFFNLDFLSPSTGSLKVKYLIGKISKETDILSVVQVYRVFTHGNLTSLDLVSIITNNGRSKGPCSLRRRFAAAWLL
jgi:hypothetical protein